MKKSLIYLSLLFSMFLFLFIPGFKVSAVSFISSDQDFLQSKLGNFDCDTIKQIAEDNNIDSNYDSFILSYTPYSTNYSYLTFFNSDDNHKIVDQGDEIDLYGPLAFFNGIKFNPLKYNHFFPNGHYGYAYYKGNNYYIINNDYKGSNSVYLSKNFECNLKSKSYNVTFHLNGGTVYDKNIINDNMVGNKYEDYTTTIQSNKIYEYINNMEFKKDGMDFKGLYYDEKLTLKFNLDQYSEITGDRDFYLKFMYKDVEEFLKNTTFNTYTFDTDYEYAIISLNSKTNKDIYLGLNYIDYSLEIHKYLKNNNEYQQGAVKCLTPYYSKDNKYYYWLESPLDNDYEVLVLPKGKFKDNNYEFLLSNNAYVSYTNDLTKVIIKNDDGQDIVTNLESSYNYSQDALLNNENDIIEIFKKLSENKNNNVFSYFNQIWNYIKRSKLYTYLLTLIIGSLIILIIHVAKR